MKTEPVRGSRSHVSYKLADGTAVPGVTTVLGVLAKPALVPWAHRLGKMGIELNAYVDGLATIGTLAHALCIHELGGAAPDLDDYTPNEVTAAGNCVRKFNAWRAGKVIEPLLYESPIVSETYRFGGTFDIYARIDGELTVVDIKTGRAIYDEHLIQVAAYRALLEERGLDVDAVRILQVGRTDEEGFSERVLRDTGPHWAIFEAALDIYSIRRALAAGERATARRRKAVRPERAI